MIVTPIGVLALAAGWIIGTPRPPNVLGGVVKNHFVPVTASQAQPEPVPSSESAQGQDGPGSGHATLTARMTAGLDRIEASPCDAATRAAFLDVLGEYSSAYNEAANAANHVRPAEWSTAADLQATERLQRLLKAGYFTDDEFGLALVRNRMGQAWLAQQMEKTGGPGPIRSTRCST
jgi:hypothetical protein